MAAKDPVTQFVVDLLYADAVINKPFFHNGNGFLNGESVEELGIDHDAGIVLECEGFLFNVAALDDLDYFAAEFLCKFPVTVIMCRYCHDSTRAVSNQNIVGDENGYLLAVYGVYALDALNLNAGLILIKLTALKVRLFTCLDDISIDLVEVFNLILPLGDILMLGRQNHIGCTEQCIGTRGIDNYLIADGGVKGDLCAGGAADPVLLLDLDSFDVIQIVQIIDKTLGVLGDGEHPLALLLADYLAAAAFANAVYDLLVCQHALAARAPVDGHGGLIGKTVLVHLQEYPLRPLIILRVGRIDSSVPIEAVAEHFELACEVRDVVSGDLGGVDMGLDGIVLGGQTECVKADGVQNIVAVHPLFPCNYINSCKGTGMTDMESLTGGVWELNKSVKLWAALIAGYRGIGLGLIPNCLPLFFYCRKIVFHFNLLPYSLLFFRSPLSRGL